MIVEAGQIALALAFIVSLYAAAASFLGVARRSPEFLVSGRFAIYSTPALLIVATGALIYAFVNNDFSVRYVAENSSLAMPREYTWVAFYAGNAGSMLYLAVIFAVMAVVAVAAIRKNLPYTSPYAVGIMALSLSFLLGVMLFLANPLARQEFTPMDGEGINPLLVHMGMFIHPPLQMAGLVSVAIPFSIAIGAMLANKGGNDEWVDQGRLWGMISWLILTAGLLLGSWWAYTILGWGGYWAWDPVENSALMPWLAMTAFVHSIMVQKRRGMFRMWNMVIIIIAFTMAQLGMFINRGGPVPSVHSFAQSSMGWLFLAFMATTMVASIGAFIWKSDTLRSRGKLESVLSRESAFLAQNVLFLTVAFVTLWGTIFPIFSEAASDTVMTVGQPFFNRVNGPMLLLLVLLMGVGPMLPWRRAAPRNILLMLRYPALAALVVGIVLYATGITRPVALIAFMTCVLVTAGIFQEWIRGTISRHRRGEAYHTAFVRLLSANRPRYGGYVVHLGIILLAAGAIGSSFYSVQRDFAMSPGDTETLGEYRFTFIGTDHASFPDREEDYARFEVYSGDDFLGVMTPFRAEYPSFRIASTIGAIHSTPIEDFYIVPSEFRGDGEAVFRVLINPMVWWMWASGPIMALGTLLALSPRRSRAAVRVRMPAGVEGARA